MLSQFLIASAIFLQAAASESYYCDSGEAMCCSNITTVSTMHNPQTGSEEAHKHNHSQKSSVSSRDVLTSYSISDSDLSEIVGIGCSVIAAVGDVSDCINETVCCTGPVYYVRPRRRFQEFALTFLDRTVKSSRIVLLLWPFENSSRIFGTWYLMYTSIIYVYPSVRTSWCCSCSILNLTSPSFLSVVFYYYYVK